MAEKIRTRRDLGLEARWKGLLAKQVCADGLQQGRIPKLRQGRVAELRQGITG